jgi:hypothetical protein
MLQSIEVTHPLVETPEVEQPPKPAARKKATASPARTPRATAAKQVRQLSPSAEPEPRLIALQATAQGRELIWERDPVLDTFLEETPSPQPTVVANPPTPEQEELAHWIMDHGRELPEVLTLWPHVKVHKQPFLQTIAERLRYARQHPEGAGNLWRLLRRVQVVLTAEQCVRDAIA